MQPTWQTPEHAGLLADVQLGQGPGLTAPTTVAWCPVNGLLAVGDRQHASLARVHLISPCCPEHKVILAVPLQGPEDDLVCVTWSPVGCRRVLLTATKSGAVSAWTQLPPPAGSSTQADMQAPPVFTLGDWWCHSVGQLLPAPAQGQQQQESLLSMQWLQPPPCWPYSNRVLQEHDFQAGSVPNMFAPAAPRRRPASLSGSLSALDQSGPGLQDSAAVSSELHWVEPGTLAFAAVLSSGKAAVGWATWSLMGQLRWQVSPSIPLLPAAVGADAGLLLTADATCSPSGVAVAMTTQQQPSTVHVVELHGNPLHHQCLGPALRSQVPVLQAKALAACSIPAAAPCTVVSICWDPNSDAQKLVTATCNAGSTAAAAVNGASSSRAGPGHVTLLSLTEQQQQQQPGTAAVPPTYLLTPLKAAPVTHTPGPQQWAWLLDGLLVGQQLLDRQTLAPLAISFEQPAAGSMQQQQHRAGPELQVLADSPHGVGVAMAQLSSSSSSLLVYSIPPVSKAAAGGEVAPTLAGRLVWSLLQQRHSWDLVQHLQQAAQPAGMSSSSQLGLNPAAAAAAADLQAQRVAQVLGLVDRKLAVQPKEVYSMYAARWDALKYAVVARTPGGEARAFSIDLRLRLLVPVLEHHLTAAAREEEARPGAASTTTTSVSASSIATASQHSQQQQQQQQQQQASGSSATAALAEYAMSVLDFEMACINTWIHRRLAAASAAAGSEGAAAAERSVKAVPCIRFCLDFRSNAKLATTGHKATDLAKLPRTSRVYQLWKLLHKATDGRTEQPTGWEDWLLDVVPGPFELHSLSQPCQYPSCIINLRLPADQLLRHMQCSPEWQQVPVLTDADITARATRLGLLPPNTLAAQAKYAQQAQLHARFRLQLPPSTPPLLDEAAAAATPTPDALQPAKRGAAAGTGTAAAKRRRWERQLRDAMGCTSGGAAVGSDEVVDLVNMGYASPSTLPLQSVDGAVQAQSDRASKAANTWAYACPVTGEVWLLV